MRKTAGKFAAMIAFGLLMASSGAITATAAPTDLPPMEDQIDAQDLAEGTLILKSSGDSPYVVPEIDNTGLLTPTKEDKKVVRTFTIGDTALNALCALPGATNRVIDKYPSKKHGTISFHCGNTSFGYKHIKARHPEAQWRAQMGGSGSWTAYMRYLQRSALKSPNIVRNQPGEKACYSTPVKVYRVVNGSPRYWKTINPSVVISKNNKKIITSIPSTRSTC